MSDTTIRVDSVVRDKLRALAEEDHTTLGDLLERLAEREQYQREMRRANELMERMEHAEPDAWREYLDELHAFEQGTAADGVGDPATEWPEFTEEAKLVVTAATAEWLRALALFYSRGHAGYPHRAASARAEKGRRA
jgi:hypothetical protein